ncbi:hypothetical protein LTR56_022386 [Elasticomyces elasticus]|nr:hypothetical protein LTR56_022386 [Elasticomyces elasticus]KAK3633205.1 hypothetical protein LTR22_020281 [Elasticomyces elasticus]KAK4922392.1 hypothetical protein LTR49_010257 [Elasticomyces elasticus]KAK5765273.1 hypothetical protein LTS12_004530 [Elasticomyces elasticus]
MAQFNLRQIDSTQPTTSQVNSSTSNDHPGQDHGINDVLGADFTNMQYDGTAENNSEQYTWGNEQFENDHQALADAGAFYRDDALEATFVEQHEALNEDNPPIPQKSDVADYEVADHQVADYQVLAYDLQQDERNEHIRRTPQSNNLTDYDLQKVVPFAPDSTPPDVAKHALSSMEFATAYELPATPAATPFPASATTFGTAGGRTQSARNHGLAAVPPLVSARKVAVKVESPQDCYTGWKRKAQDEDFDDEEIKPFQKTSKISKVSKTSKTPKTLKRNGKHKTKQIDRRSQEYGDLGDFDCKRAKLQVSYATDAAVAAMTTLKQTHAKYLAVIRNPGNEEELRQTLAMEANLIEHIKAISDAVTAEHEAKLGS